MPRKLIIALACLVASAASAQQAPDPAIQKLALERCQVHLTAQSNQQIELEANYLSLQAQLESLKKQLADAKANTLQPDKETGKK